MLVFFGTAIAAIGWLFMLFGAGASTELPGMPVINIHLLTIANNVIWLGYVMIVVGVIKAGFEGRTAGFVLAGPKMKDHSKSTAEETDARFIGAMAPLREANADEMKRALADAEAFNKQR